MLEQANHLAPLLVDRGRESVFQPDRTNEDQDRHSPGQADLCQASGHRRARLCQPTRAKTIGSLHAPLENESGCAMEVVRAGSQHW